MLVLQSQSNLNDQKLELFEGRPAGMLELKDPIERIVEMLVHVMIASQERCLEMARKTNTDKSFCREARLVYRLLTN